METKKKYYTPVPQDEKEARRQAFLSEWQIFANDFDARWKTAWDSLPLDVTKTIGVSIKHYLLRNNKEAISIHKIHNTKQKKCRNIAVLKALEGLAKEFQK